MEPLTLRLNERLPVTTAAMPLDLGRMCRLLVHELRTPLASIVANSELVLAGAAGGASGGVRAAVAEVAAAARRLEAAATTLRQLDAAMTTPRSAPIPVDLVIACREAGITASDTTGPRHAAEADPSRVVSALRAAAAWMRAGAATAIVNSIIAMEHEKKGSWVTVTLAAAPAVHERDDLGGLDILLCRLLVAAEGGNVHPLSDGLLMRWPLARGRMAGDPC